MINRFKWFIKCLALVIVVVFSSCNGQKTNGDANKKTVATPDDSTKIPVKTFFPQIHSHLQGMVREFIFKIHEDKKGRYWFGTNNGWLIEYDGQSLTRYTQKDGLGQGGSSVRAIVEDSLDNLWLGTSGGLAKYDGETFTNFTLGDEHFANQIWTLAIDKKGIIWVGTNNGVSKFDGNKFTPFQIPKAEIDSTRPMISKERISGITIDRKGQIWFVTDGYGISKFDGQHFEFLTSKNGLTNNSVADVFEDSKGNIWIGTYYGGVSMYDGKTFTNFTKDGAIEGVETYNFLEDKNGNIWFSAEGYGVYKYDGSKFTQFTTDDGLTTNGVQHIYEDRKGQIWFCTWQGISVYDGSKIVNISDKEPWTE